jgi:hypothetical protein
MDPASLLASLLELAGEHGLTVRRIASEAPFEGLAPVASGVCVVRGRRYAMLCPTDPPERQIAVLARALRDHAGDLLEARFLPPAVRACLENARGDGA